MHTTSRTLALAFSAAFLFSTAACRDGQQGATSGEGDSTSSPATTDRVAIDPAGPTVGDINGTMGDTMAVDTTMGTTGTGTTGTAPGGE